MNESTSGQIFTFYSYKGGTGRSMALANVACLIAEKQSIDQKVLMIDWDLEAPGLHRFFDEGLAQYKVSLSSQPGLIDLFYKIQESCQKNIVESEITDNFFEKLQIEKYIIQTGIDSLYLMTAGMFDNSYSTRVNRFNWEGFFNQSPWLFSKFADYLARKFRYTLIDSRTGFTDISSICTALMPEKLVLVFTPNRQSLSGVLNLVKETTDYRKRSDDLRPLIIFPLVSRVENAEEDLQKTWRFGDIEKGIIGYQPEFESILKDVYDLPECDLSEYFNEVKIQHVPKYSFGEEIAVLSTNTEDRLSLAASYENFLQRFLQLEGPWAKFEKVLTQENAIEPHVGVYELNRTLRVFLTYSPNDKSLVRELYQKLRAETWIHPWLDEEELYPGQDWNTEIKKAVEASDIILVCLSNSSVTSEGYVQRDLRIVLDFADSKPEGAIYIIPVRLEETEPPRRLRAWQYADYFPEFKRERAFQRLLVSLKRRADFLGLKIETFDNTAFLMLPFAKDFEGLYEEISSIVNEMDLVARRMDSIVQAKDLMSNILDEISRSRFAIADLSEKNPNVYFETGLAHAMGKNVILLTRKEKDISHILQTLRYIVYEDTLEGGMELRTTLRMAIKQALADKSLPGQFQSDGFEKNSCLVLSREDADSQDTFERIIRPFLSESKIKHLQLKDIFDNRDVLTAIIEKMNSSQFVIADISKKDIDIFYLVGYAYGLGKDVIYLTRSDKDIPFDLRISSSIIFVKDTQSSILKARADISVAVKRLLEKPSSIRVFINHAVEDKHLARKLYLALKKHPWIDPWMDEEKLLPGQELEIEIDKAMKESDAILVCISNLSIKKIGYIQTEIRKAEEQQKLRPPGSIYMIPVLLEPCKNQIPSNLQKYLWVDISDPAKIDLIIKSLETLRK